MTLSLALVENWIFGEFFCKIANFTPTVTALISTFTVAIISVERWFFIVNKKKFDHRCTIVTLILLWIISILIALPDFLSRYIEEFTVPSIPYSIMNMNSSFDTFNSTDLLKIPMSKSSCQMEKRYFCVLNSGLRMRIFSYMIITVQYLVPLLFVSVSCYSISRFLKRRMKQMRTYQMSHTTNMNFNLSKQRKKAKFQYQRSYLTKLNEQESSTTIVRNEKETNSFVSYLRNTFQSDKQHRNSIVIHEKNNRTSPIVNAIILPTVKSQSDSERRFHRSRKLLMCVAALFTISWLPLTVAQIYLEHHEEVTRDEPNFVYAFLLIPCYLISSLPAWINPIIYNYVNRNFRREFYALYPCCCNVESSSTAVRKEIVSVLAKRSQKQT